MPTISALLQGYNIRTNDGSIAFCSVGLVRGERTYLVDVSQPGRRTQLLAALGAAGLAPRDIDAVIAGISKHLESPPKDAGTSVLRLGRNWWATSGPARPGWTLFGAAAATRPAN